jgi:hypothetical protein
MRTCTTEHNLELECIDQRYADDGRVNIVSPEQIKDKIDFQAAAYIWYMPIGAC